MKVLLTESQAERLIEDVVVPSGPGTPVIMCQDGIDINSPEIKRLIDKMKTLYNVFKKGSGNVITRDNQELMVEYELPPIEKVEFIIYKSNFDGNVPNIYTRPYNSEFEPKFVVTNFDEFPDLGMMGSYTMEEFADSNKSIFFAGTVQKKFSQFGIKIW